jgi:hypothetical protein
MPRSPQDCQYGNRWLKFFRKWHRWPGLILGLFFILWAISGIVMNHRGLFSGFDINRKYLPAEHRYTNWNNAAVKSAVKIGEDSLLIYGNIGIWLTDSTFSSFSDFNKGFRNGIDNRKISSMLVTGNGNIYAGTLFGLFHYNKSGVQWEKIDIKIEDERIQWLVEKQGNVMVLTRSELFELQDDPGKLNFWQLQLPPPQGYDDKTGLFRTIWVIHSGEIYGQAGKLIVDALGLIVILLAITGVLHFSMPYALRKLKKQKKSLKLASSTKRTSAKWHKKAGIWIAIFILINTITGMFLRPPLLITIANARVGKIPWSVLDTPNPWEDKLRAIIYDEEAGAFIFGTSEGLFYTDEGLSNEMVPLSGQPPLSVMGINVFQKTAPGNYMIGSFNGLFDWSARNGVARNHLTGELVVPSNSGSKPFGEKLVSGYLKLENGNSVYFDYNTGAEALGDNLIFKDMPSEILENSPMSWWNVALEVHTGRIFKPITGDFYILIVPLLGLFGTILVISGIVVWIKLYLRKNRSCPGPKQMGP